MTPEEIAAIAKAIAAELRAELPDSIDWSQVEIASPSNSRPQCGKLDDASHFKLSAIANKSYEGSMAAVIKTAVMCYLRQKWPRHCEDFQAIAAREGITIEECITRMGRGEVE